MLELIPNRIYRPFIDGFLLDEFSGKEHPCDGHFPERWVCSTTNVGGDLGNVDISTAIDGTLLTEHLPKPL